MGRKYTLALGGMMFAAALIIAAYAAMPKAPKIALSAYSFDAGDIDPAKGKWEKVFYIKNKGNAPLVIEGISTSCGCTTAEAAESELLPGESTQLKVVYDPNTHPGITGRIERVVYVSSNDPENSEAELKITANVVPGEAQ